MVVWTSLMLCRVHQLILDKKKKEALLSLLVSSHGACKQCPYQSNGASADVLANGSGNIDVGAQECWEAHDSSLKRLDTAPAPFSMDTCLVSLHVRGMRS
jgi:hypothetical protein